METVTRLRDNGITTKGVEMNSSERHGKTFYPVHHPSELLENGLPEVDKSKVPTVGPYR